MTHSLTYSSPDRRRPFASGFLSGAMPPRAVFSWLAGLQERADQRRRLRDLEDWQLRDIGVTREQSLRESRKPFWLR